MKIAIPTKGNKLKDEVALHFGRAKNFLIYDAKTNNFKIYQNPEVAGKIVLPPDFLKKLGVETVICFGLGPPAFNLFKNYKVKIKKAIKGSIKKNIELFQREKLRDFSEKDIF